MAGKIFLAGAIRGLVSEGERVAHIMEGVGPDVLALSVSPEGLEAMDDTGKLTPAQTGPSNPEEEIYMEGLSEFGEVVKPPPCFSVARELAIRAGTPIKALDMDDEHYTAAYCKYVTTLDMIRQGRSGKRLYRYVFIAETPEEFVSEWDGLVNRFKGYMDLENAREEWLAKGISRLSGTHDRVLTVIELERLDGLLHRLESLGCDFEVVQ